MRGAWPVQRLHAAGAAAAAWHLPHCRPPCCPAQGCKRRPNHAAAVDPTCLGLHPGGLVLQHHVHGPGGLGQLRVNGPRKRVDPLQQPRGQTSKFKLMRRADAARGAGSWQDTCLVHASQGAPFPVRHQQPPMGLQQPPSGHAGAGARQTCGQEGSCAHRWHPHSLQKKRVLVLGCAVQGWVGRRQENHDAGRAAAALADCSATAPQLPPLACSAPPLSPGSITRYGTRLSRPCTCSAAVETDACCMQRQQ